MITMCVLLIVVSIADFIPLTIYVQTFGPSQRCFRVFKPIRTVLIRDKAALQR